jgi:hypothetical protein
MMDRNLYSGDVIAVSEWNLVRGDLRFSFEIAALPPDRSDMQMRAFAPFGDSVARRPLFRSRSGMLNAGRIACARMVCGKWALHRHARTRFVSQYLGFPSKWRAFHYY